MGVSLKGLFSVHLGIVGYNNTDEAYQGLSSSPQLPQGADDIVVSMRAVTLRASLRAWFEGVSNLQFTTFSFCVQVWSLTKFYRLNRSLIANLTLDSKLTPVLCHHWQDGDVGCGNGVWTPVMKIHGDQV